LRLVALMILAVLPAIGIEIRSARKLRETASNRSRKKRRAS
jgi:hypothetical protein